MLPKKEFKKLNSREMEVFESVVKQSKKILSYDRILNDIQEYEAKLNELYQFKAEAEKLNLIR